MALRGLKITGTGNIDGQAMKFMTTYSGTDERWEPKKFRPRMFSLKRCQDLEISGISFGHSPQWGMHLLGCERVLVDGVRVRNYMDVPNCDGIDPDRCRDVEIQNCDIVCADDGVVIKASEQSEDYGSSRNIVVKDCVVTSRDSGLKIGTETFGDISKVLFERCKVISGGRGPTITHRQPGNIEDVEFREYRGERGTPCGAVVGLGRGHISDCVAAHSGGQGRIFAEHTNAKHQGAFGEQCSN